MEFIYFIIYVLVTVAQWKIFEKADVDGWKALIPIYNIIVGLNILKLSGWNIIWLFIPIVNFLYLIYLNYRLAKAFGEGVAFAAGLCFIPGVFHMILGFGDYKYTTRNLY
ncbi:MAG: DUF5684 domain-containing protein [Fusobacteriaceae bacterium]